MMKKAWRFTLTEEGYLRVIPPDDEDAAKIAPLQDFTSTELGTNLITYQAYEGIWRRISADPVSASRGLSGNGTHIRIDGDELVLSGLFDQWPQVRIPVDEFNDYMDQYRAFLRESARTAN